MASLSDIIFTGYGSNSVVRHLGPVGVTDYSMQEQSVHSASNWFKTETRSGVPESAMPWLIAQGWTVTGSQTRYGTKTYDLQRRAIDSEAVLDSLISDYTAAYNEGRQLNDSRYDNIAAIYIALDDSLFASFQAMESMDQSFDTLVDLLAANMFSNHTDYSTDVEGDLDDYGDSLRDEINARFDARLSTARQELVSRGLYNSTTWDTMAAGIERERSRALTDAEDRIVHQQLNLKHRVYDTRQEIRLRVLAARERLHQMMQGSSHRMLELRTNVVRALTDFMERRTDGYPDLSAIGSLAAHLGAGNPAGFQP